MASRPSRVVLAGLTGLALMGQSMAVPTTTTQKLPGGSCTEFTFPVTASANNFKFESIPKNLQIPIVLEDFILSTASDVAGTGATNVGRIETNGTYSMSAIYCVPDKVAAGRTNTIQYLQVSSAVS